MLNGVLVVYPSAPRLFANFLLAPILFISYSFLFLSKPLLCFFPFFLAVVTHNFILYYSPYLTDKNSAIGLICAFFVCLYCRWHSTGMRGSPWRSYPADLACLFQQIRATPTSLCTGGRSLQSPVGIDESLSRSRTPFRRGERLFFCPPFTVYYM